MPVLRPPAKYRRAAGIAIRVVFMEAQIMA
jgi:hypothetical protein